MSGKLGDALMAVSLGCSLSLAILGEQVLFEPQVDLALVGNWMSLFCPLILFFLYVFMRLALASTCAQNVHIRMQCSFSSYFDLLGQHLVGTAMLEEHSSNSYPPGCWSNIQPTGSHLAVGYNASQWTESCSRKRSRDRT